MKICTKCKTKKKSSQFYKDNRRGGLRGECKECLSRVYFSNSDFFKNKRKEFYRKNKRRLLCADKIYRDNNKEKISKRRRKYRLRNKKKIAESMKKWKNSDKGKLWVLLSNAKRRALRISTDDGTINIESVKKIWTGKCKICNGKILIKARRGKKYHCHLDHIIPLSKKGKHSIKNVQWLCSWCNISKFDKT